MNNFIRSSVTLNGIIFSRYTADRRRGKNYIVFFNRKPPSTIYSPTWPEAITGDSAFNGVQFISMLINGNLHVDFYHDISEVQQDALDLLYGMHTAPVPVWG